ncbi:mitochondrial ATPase expression-domain-containing protein [Tuber indicum]|nr:mitochondrial ATPase expression-domain-containing protein [Tuber indicum]
MQAHNQGLTYQLSAGEFSSVLLSIRPRRYLSLRPRHYIDEYGRGQVHKVNYSFKEFRSRLRIVTQAMQRQGYQLGIIEYCHLLDCARAGGDLSMADDLWRQIVAREDLTPDTWTYNCYIAAKIGTIAIGRGVRMSQWTMQSRQTVTAKRMRALASQMYAQMIREAVHPNSMTFDLLVIAMSRAGDIGGVKELLMKVWGVNVNGLAKSDNNLGSEPPTVSSDSVIYPTQHTLATFSMCFGSNNDIETAIRVVDHVSRRYKVPISLPAWINLLNWTYALTRPPAPVMPARSVLQTWETMRAPPYNVNPTIEMYDYLVRSLISRQYVSPAEDKMKEAVEMYVDLLERFIDLDRKYDTVVGETDLDTAVQQTEVLKEIAVVKRELHRFRSMMRRWVELLILGKGMNTEYTRRKVPDIVAAWAYFLGGKAIYTIDSGYIVLELGQEREWTPIPIRRRKRPWMPLGTGAKEVDYLD